MTAPGCLAGGLMVCGTGSDSGKSTVVAGLCRLLARRGLRVAPFKAQNMALNSAVTAAGHEIGRAQAAQAAAAGVEPEVAMNPVLLKPTDHRTSQVVVEGRPWTTLDAAGYHKRKTELWPVVTAHLADLRRRFDAVICEGAGSPAEINLLDADIVNLQVARHAGYPAIVVGDIDRGGVFAALFGTVMLLPPDQASLIKGFVINKFRGDPALLGDGPAELERRTGVPTLGVLPWLDRLGLDAEDSLALRGDPWHASLSHSGGTLDVAVVRLPRISNFTDFEALALEPGIDVRLVHRSSDLGRPDLIVLPGSKATVADLGWLRQAGIDRELCRLAGDERVTVLGICAGYQMMGASIEDPDGVESPAATSVAGLGLVPGRTIFHATKTTRRVGGRALGCPVSGYEIHHGVTVDHEPWIDTDHGPEGSQAGGGRLLGTGVHGLLENDAFRRALLGRVARRAGRDWEPGSDVSFAVARQRQWDDLADALEAHLDVEAILALIKSAEGSEA
ncbi:MAG: cobyric acid synthase [Acidimicrobiales bacterium]|nr:cobyric acid synthase [Acidimicrobiales bacterium]